MVKGTLLIIGIKEALVIMKKIYTLLACLLCSITLSALASADKKSHAQKYVKPGAPVYLVEPHFVQMAPNSEQLITIQLATPDTGVLSIDLKPANGISFAESNHQEFKLNGQNTQLNLTLSTQSAGQYDLMLHTEINDDSLSTTRVLGFQVQVGAAPAVTKTTFDEPLVRMKAQETIR